MGVPPLRGMLFWEYSVLSTSSTPTLKALRETPTTHIYAVGASAASLVELLGAVLGNPNTALAVLNQFPALEDIAGIGKSSAKQQESRAILPGCKSPLCGITRMLVARLERKRHV